MVLKFDQNVLHHGSLGVIRSLGRLGVPVYGVHEGPWAPAASSRYLAGRFFWQPVPMIRNGPCLACSTWPARSGAGRCCTRRTMRARSSWPSTGNGLRQAFPFPRPGC